MPEQELLVVKVVGDWTAFDEEARRREAALGGGITFSVERSAAQIGQSGFSRPALPAPGETAFENYVRDQIAASKFAKANSSTMHYMTHRSDEFSNIDWNVVGTGLAVLDQIPFGSKLVHDSRHSLMFRSPDDRAVTIERDDRFFIPRRGGEDFDLYIYENVPWDPNRSLRKRHHSNRLPGKLDILDFTRTRDDLGAEVVRIRTGTDFQEYGLLSMGYGYKGPERWGPLSEEENKYTDELMERLASRGAVRTYESRQDRFFARGQGVPHNFLSLNFQDWHPESWANRRAQRNPIVPWAGGPGDFTGVMVDTGASSSLQGVSPVLPAPGETAFQGINKLAQEAHAAANALAQFRSSIITIGGGGGGGGGGSIPLLPGGGGPAQRLLPGPWPSQMGGDFDEIFEGDWRYPAQLPGPGVAAARGRGTVYSAVNVPGQGGGGLPPPGYGWYGGGPPGAAGVPAAGPPIPPRGGGGGWGWRGGGGGIPWGGLNRAYYYSIIFSLWEAGRAQQISRQMQIETALAPSDLERLQAVSSNIDPLFGGVFSQPFGMTLDLFDVGPSSVRDLTRMQEVRLTNLTANRAALREIGRGEIARTPVALNRSIALINARVEDQISQLTEERAGLVTSLGAAREMTFWEQQQYSVDQGLRGPLFGRFPRVNIISDEGVRSAMESRITIIGRQQENQRRQQRFDIEQAMREYAVNIAPDFSRARLARLRGTVTAIDMARAELTEQHDLERQQIALADPGRLTQIAVAQIAEQRALDRQYFNEQNALNIGAQSTVTVMNLQAQRRYFQASIAEVQGRYLQVAGAPGADPNDVRRAGMILTSQINALVETERFSQDQQSIEIVGQTETLRLLNRRQPLAAALRRIATQRQLAINAVPEGPYRADRVSELNDLFDAQTDAAETQFADQKLDVQTNLRYQRESLNLLLARRPLAAQAVGLVGQGEQTIRGLLRQGLPEEAAEARENLGLALRFQRQQIFDQYRAQETSPYGAFGVQANGQQDIGQALRTIEELLRRIADKEFGGLAN